MQNFAENVNLIKADKYFRLQGWITKRACWGQAQEPNGLGAPKPGPLRDMTVTNISCRTGSGLSQNPVETLKKEPLRYL